MGEFALMHNGWGCLWYAGGDRGDWELKHRSCSPCPFNIIATRAFADYSQRGVTPD